MCILVLLNQNNFHENESKKCFVVDYREIYINAQFSCIFLYLFIFLLSMKNDENVTDVDSQQQKNKINSEKMRKLK